MPSFHKGLALRLVVAVAAILFLPMLTPSASAGVIPPGYFDANIVVAQNGAAQGTVTDTLNPYVTYTTALTSSGGGTCLLTTGEVVLDDFGTNYGNPSITTTKGACSLYDASVLYTLTWTSILGTTGQTQVACYWLLGNRWCSDGHVHGDPQKLLGPIG